MAERESAAAQGAASGAATGTMISPGWGTAIGAGVGGLMGYYTADKQEKEAARAHKENQEKIAEQNKYAAFYGNAPTTLSSRVRGDPAGAAMGGMIMGAQQGAQFANMYNQGAPAPAVQPVAPPPSQLQNPYQQQNPYAPHPTTGEILV